MCRERSFRSGRTGTRTRRLCSSSPNAKMTISGIFDLFADEQISQRIALKCVGLAFRKYRAKEMRWIFALVAILISVAAVAADTRCDQFPKERKFVQQLYAELRVVQNDSAYPAWSLHLPAYDKLLKSP